MQEKRDEAKVNIATFSLKTALIVVIGVALFIQYINILMFGENSLSVLNKLKEKEQILLKEKKLLKSDNQRLQKEYFQLKQLESKE